MSTLPTTLGNPASPTPQRRVQGYGVPGGPDLSPLNAGANAIAQSQQAMSRAGEQLGAAVKDVGQKIISQQDHDAMIEAADRENQYQAKMQDYLYNPDTGIMNLRGKDALGISEKAKTDIAAMRAQALDGITNPMAAESLGKSLNSYSNNALESINRFESGQKQDYHAGVMDDRLKTSQNAVTLQPYDDKGFSNTLNQALAAQDQLTAMKYGKGADPEVYAAGHQQVASSLWMTRIGSAITSNDATAILKANDWYQQARAAGQLTASDDIELGNKFKAVVPKLQAQQAMANDLPHLTAASVPVDNILKAQIQFESGGNRNAVGPYIPGQGTAKSEMQVMDATNKDPGYGVKPAQNDSLEERARVGHDYMQAMLTKYNGDTMLALAAYNAGPATMDKALEKAKGDKRAALALMPAQTQNYVTGIIGAAQQMSGAPQIDMNMVMDNVKGMPPDQAQYYISQAQTKNAQMAQAWNQQRDQTIQQIQQSLQSSNGDINAVPDDLKAQAIKMGVWDRAASFRGFTDPAVKNRLDSMSPDQLSQVDFTDPQISLHLSASDRSDYLKKQNDLVTNPDNKIMEDRIAGAANYVFQTAGLANPEDIAGVNTRRTGKNDNTALYDKMAQFKNLLRVNVQQYYAANKKVPDTNAINKMADELIMNRSITLKPGNVGYGSSGAAYIHPFGRFLGMDDSQTLDLTDIHITDIPPEVRTAIESARAVRGLPNNEADVISTYQLILKNQTSQAGQ